MLSLFKENKITLTLAIPIITGQLSQMLLGLIDTLMIGRVGTDELATAAFVNVLFNTPFVLAIGLFAAVSMQVSHEHGASKHAEAAESFRHGLLVSIVTGFLLCALLIGIMPFLEHLRQPPEILRLTPSYLFWMALSLIPMVPALTIKSFAEAKNRPWEVLWIMLSTVLINVVLNYLLIFGNFGFPKLGLAGAGIATFLARLMSFLALWLYLTRSKKLAESRPHKWLKPLEIKRCWALLKMSAPIAGQLAMEIGSFSIAALFIGQFGSAALASHQIGLTCAAFMFMIPLGLSMAVTIRVGHSRGAGEYTRCKNIILGAHGTAFLIMSTSAVCFTFYGEALASVFTQDPIVIQTAATIFTIVAFFQIFDGAQIISMGALRGLHDVNVPTLIIFISFWIIGIPFGVWLGFAQNLEASGLWIGLATGLGLAATALSLRVQKLIATNSHQ